MSRSFEELVEAKFREDIKQTTILYMAFYGITFVVACVGIICLNSDRSVIAAILFAAAALFGISALWASVDVSLNLVEANKIKYAREARQEIAAEAKRAEEARQGQE